MSLLSGPANDPLRAGTGLASTTARPKQPTKPIAIGGKLVRSGPEVPVVKEGFNFPLRQAVEYRLPLRYWQQCYRVR